MRAATALATTAVVLASQGAWAQTKERCLADFDRAQVLRDAGKLRAARATFTACADAACPAVLREDCHARALEIDAESPTIVPSARDTRGVALEDARVFVDGAPVEGAPGAPFPVDPGPHVVRFERAPLTPVEVSIVVLAGERGRVVRGQFATPDAPPSNGERERALSPWVVGLGALGVAGLGGFTYFALHGKDRRDTMLATCAPACDPHDASRIKTDYAIADVSMFVGLAALAGAIIVYAATPPATASP